MAPPDSKTAFDFIIVGGGTAGCVAAARLHEALPDLSIALIEAGEDASSNLLVQDPRAAQALHETYLQWKYTSVPQTHLKGRTLPNWGGRLLGGQQCGQLHRLDPRPCCGLRSMGQSGGRRSLELRRSVVKRSEHWHDAEVDTAQLHGFDGPIRTQSVDCRFPLREPMRDAFLSVGFEFDPDMNSGDPNGIAPLVLNWHELKRQHAATCYNLDGVHVLANSVVSKVLVDDDARATGVQLAGDRAELHATREVIVSCGGIRTPQLLLLSGIGPEDELEKHNIPVKLNLPTTPIKAWRWAHRHSTDPSFAESFPCDWFITGKAPDNDLEKAAKLDGTRYEARPRSDYELTPMYLTNGAVPQPWLPFDGSYISCGVMCLSTTSRGIISLNSTDVNENRILDPGALYTEHDRAVLRAGMCAVIDTMASPAMDPYLVETAIPPPGLKPLSKFSTDEELDEHIEALAFPWFPAAGTAAMGKVVDAECRVKGIKGLRIVDSSVIPLSVTAHLQAQVYALAEQAAAMIIRSAR